MVSRSERELRDECYRAVEEAKRAGLLVPGPCAVGGPRCAGKIQPHHNDHSRPLDIVWLCHFHHSKLSFQYRRRMQRARARGESPDPVETRRATLKGLHAGATQIVRREGRAPG